MIIVIVITIFIFITLFTRWVLSLNSDFWVIEQELLHFKFKIENNEVIIPRKMSELKEKGQKTSISNVNVRLYV